MASLPRLISACLARVAARRSSNLPNAPCMDKSRPGRPAGKALKAQHTDQPHAGQSRNFGTLSCHTLLRAGRPAITLTRRPVAAITAYFGRCKLPVGRTWAILPIASVITSRAISAMCRLIHSSISGLVTSATARRIVSRDRWCQTRWKAQKLRPASQSGFLRYRQVKPLHIAGDILVGHGRIMRRVALGQILFKTGSALQQIANGALVIILCA